MLDRHKEVAAAILLDNVFTRKKTHKKKLFPQELHALMGEKVWTSFANHYARIARGDANGLDAYIYVKDIVDWYQKNKAKMDELCLKSKITGDLSMHYHWTLWLECKEMWIDSTLEQRKDLLQLLRSGKFDKFNMYQKWKIINVT
jgi:hypothetical protein